MIDLDQLRRSAAGPQAGEDAEKAVVTRSWLKEVSEEIAAGRAAQAQLRMNETTMGICAAIAGEAVEL